MSEHRVSDAGDRNYVAGLVRERDRLRYYADLFIAADRRRHVFALHALNVEVCNIPASVAEPGLGDIRFQWWHDAVLDAADASRDAETPIMREVALAIRDCRLPVSALTGLIDAHRNDLYGDPMPTMQDLEGYYGETDAALFQLVCLVLGSNGAQTANASGHAGIAFGLAGQLSQLALSRRLGRQVASADLLDIYGLQLESMYAEEPAEGSSELIIHLTNLAMGHYRAAREEIGQLPDILQTAFLPLALVPAMTRRIQKDPARVMREPLKLSDLSALARIFRAAVTGV